MEKLKVAAIQPKYIPIPNQYVWYSKEYKNISEEIVKQYIEKQLEVTIKLLEKSGKVGCDIVTTCEDIAGLSEYIVNGTETNIFPELVKQSQSLVENRLSDIAEKYSMYVIGCYYRTINDRIYNVASIFDRKGIICGEYRKTHLPANEKWQCQEGETIHVFELDFGTIGICICYDMMFPEVIQVQALKGAKIIFHPTLGYGWYDSIGEATLRTRANDNSVYIVTSKNHIYNGAGKSSIIDFWGQVAADAGFYENVIVYKEIDLNFKKNQPQWHYATQTSGMDEVNIRKLHERRPELYSLIACRQHQQLTLPDNKARMQILKNIKEGKCHW